MLAPKKSSAEEHDSSNESQQGLHQRADEASTQEHGGGGEAQGQRTRNTKGERADQGASPRPTQRAGWNPFIPNERPAHRYEGKRFAEQQAAAHLAPGNWFTAGERDDQQGQERLWGTAQGTEEGVQASRQAQMQSTPPGPNSWNIVPSEMGLVDFRNYDWIGRDSEGMRDAMAAWGPVPREVACDCICACTDGSATMTKKWPMRPIDAGFGAVLFARDLSGCWHFLGGLWAPVQAVQGIKKQVHQQVPTFGALRPTSPVSEISAAIAVLTWARACARNIPVHIVTDSKTVVAHVERYTLVNEER